MKINDRLSYITEYHFKKMDEIKKTRLEAGKEIIDLGIGDPDLPVNRQIIDELIKGIEVSGFNNYPPYEGLDILKKEIIRYYRETYDVILTEEEVVILIGSKEGLSNIIPATCNIGDMAIIPQPGYPAYESCCWLWGVTPYKVSLNENNHFFPKVEGIPANVLDRSKLWIVNYPCNPLGVVANLDFYREHVHFCEKHGILLCNDSAYNEIIKENAVPISILQADPKKQTLEFGTFSKTFNMTGFRIGYAVGNSEVIKALLKVKTNLDSGQFKPIQLAAIEALKLGNSYIRQIRRVYDERRELAEELLQACNIKYIKPEGTFYIWCQVPQGYTTKAFCEDLLASFGVIITPGSVFGEEGENFFRISLTKERSQIERALKNFKKYAK